MPEVSWETVSVLSGDNTMPNFGECPSVARESTLSQILQANAPEKYYLSAKACAGILRRAEKRNWKGLAPELKEALERQALCDGEAVARGGVKEHLLATKNL